MENKINLNTENIEEISIESEITRASNGYQESIRFTD